MNKIVILGSIVVFAFLVRMAGIEHIPPSLNWDEVSHGYNAYSVLETGRDEWGEFIPLIFRAYGDYKLPVYIYLTTVSEFFFGTSALSVRLPSVLAGTSTVLFAYLLARELFPKRKGLALFTAMLVAIEPWGLFLSRIALEANVAVAFVTSGVYFALVGLRRKSWYVVLSAILLGLSVWTYNSVRIFVPLLLVSLTAIYRQEVAAFFVKKRKVFALSTAIIAVFFVPMGLQLLASQGQARYESVRILDAGAIGTIEESRRVSTFSPVLTRIVYNRPVHFLTEVSKNYIAHFSPSFLFINGGDNFQFNVPGHGLLYGVNAAFMVFGLYFLIRHRKNNASKLILIWLLLSPVASSVTRESPHALRSAVFLPVPMLLSALGIVKVSEFIKESSNQKIVFGFYGLLLLLLVTKYLNLYATDYRQGYSQAFQYGYEQAVEFAKENYDKYEKIVVTKKYGEPHEFFLFYGIPDAPWETDPKSYREDPNLVRFNQSNWWWVDRFDKFYFVNDWEVPRASDNFVLESGGKFQCLSGCLLITSPGNYPVNWKPITTINFLDDTPAFDIVEKI